MDSIDMLKQMSEAAGVSGYESAIAEILKGQTDMVQSMRQDSLGNLILLKSGHGPEPRPKLMLAAHMDEIGLMVTKIEDSGFLRVSPVGGVDPRILPGQEVVVLGKEVRPGIVGMTPPHLDKTPRTKALPMEKLFIDIGCRDKEEAETVIQVGDTMVMSRTPTQLAEGLLAGKAMDDRAGVAAMLECLKQLKTINHQADIYAVATVQEEVGLRGALTSTYGIAPDIGIAIDVCHGTIPGLPPGRSLELGQGPGIAVGPNVHPKIFQKLTSIADEWAIPYGIEPNPNPNGTDAYAIQIAQSGVPTALISIPLRYMHTPVETLSQSDVLRAGRLLALFAAAVNIDFLEGFHCY